MRKLAAMAFIPGNTEKKNLRSLKLLVFLFPNIEIDHSFAFIHNNLCWPLG